MSKKSKETLAAGMSKAARPRSTGELQAMFGRPAPSPVAVPMRDDAYEIALDHIKSDPDQPRKIFDEAQLRELADSIRENGVLQAITVYQSEDPETYLIITGERRFRAARLAGLTAIPCIVRSHDHDRSTIDQQQLVENIQRADLAPLEAARALQTLMDRHNYSQVQAAKRLGKPRSFVVELVSILKIPEKLLSRPGVERLPKQTLVEVSRAPADEQGALLKKALSGGSLRDVREKRTNRDAAPRPVYFREEFLLENVPPIEIRWKKDPDEVTSEQLVEVLGRVVRTIVGRATK